MELGHNAKGSAPPGLLAACRPKSRVRSGIGARLYGASFKVTTEEACAGVVHLVIYIIPVMVDLNKANSRSQPRSNHNERRHAKPEDESH